MSLLLCDITDKPNNTNNLITNPDYELVNLRGKYMHCKVFYLPYANNGNLIECSNVKIYKLDSLDDFIFNYNNVYYKLPSNVYDQSKFNEMTNIIYNIFKNNPFVLIHNLLYIDLRQEYLINQLKKYYNVSRSTSYALYEINETYVPSILILNSSSDNYSNNNLLTNDGAVAYNLAIASYYFTEKEIMKSLENIKLTPKPNRRFSISSLKYYINQNKEVYEEFIKPIEDKKLINSDFIIEPYGDKMINGFKLLAILISRRNKYNNLSDKVNNITFEYILSAPIYVNCLVYSYYYLKKRPIPKEKYSISV